MKNPEEKPKHIYSSDQPFGIDINISYGIVFRGKPNSIEKLHHIIIKNLNENLDGVVIAYAKTSGNRLKILELECGEEIIGDVD